MWKSGPRRKVVSSYLSEWSGGFFRSAGDGPSRNHRSIPGPAHREPPKGLSLSKGRNGGEKPWSDASHVAGFVVQHVVRRGQVRSAEYTADDGGRTSSAFRRCCAGLGAHAAARSADVCAVLLRSVVRVRAFVGAARLVVWPQWATRSLGVVPRYFAAGSRRAAFQFADAHYGLQPGHGTARRPSRPHWFLRSDPGRGQRGARGVPQSRGRIIVVFGRHAVDTAATIVVRMPPSRFGTARAAGG